MLRKTFRKFFMSYSELLYKCGAISFRQYVSKGIIQLRRFKGAANFISSGSKLVKRLRRCQYDPSIIESTKGLVLKCCNLINKVVWSIWRALSKPSQKRQGPVPRPLLLLCGTPSAFVPILAYRLPVAQPILTDVTSMSATRPKCTKIGDFSAQGWNLPKIYMQTCLKRRVLINHTSDSSFGFVTYEKCL